MAKASTSSELYTLTEVSNRTDISMPTLQRYKKLYQDRIPSEGKGRSQRYPEAALEVFRQLKEENMGRRGRPRTKSDDEPAGGGGRGSRVRRRRERRRGRRGGAEGAAPTREKKESTAPKSGDLLTLTQIGEITGISYPTLMRYVKAHLDDIPHEGSGRKRRYKPAAVDVFRDLRSRSRRGRRPASEKSEKAKPAARGRKAAATPAAKTGTGGGTADASVNKRLASLEAAVGRIEKLLSGGLQVRFGKG